MNIRQTTLRFNVKNKFRACKLFETTPKWNESKIIVCNRVAFDHEGTVNLANKNVSSQETTFSSNRFALLGTVICGILKYSEVYVQEYFKPNLKISTCPPESSGDSEVQEIFNETIEAYCTSDNQICLNLNSPVLIKPMLMYKVQVEFSYEIMLKLCGLKNTVYLDGNIQL